MLNAIKSCQMIIEKSAQLLLTSAGNAFRDEDAFRFVSSTFRIHVQVLSIHTELAWHSGNALCYRIKCQGILSVREYSLLWNALCLGVDMDPFVVENDYSFLSVTLFAFRSNHAFIHCLSNYN